MKQKFLKLVMALCMLLGTALMSYADRCETTGNVSVEVSAYSGNVTWLTYTFHNYNTDQVTVSAEYTLTSTNGEVLSQGRVYVIPAGGQKSESFNSNIFDNGESIKANACNCSISVSVCQ